MKLTLNHRRREVIITEETKNLQTGQEIQYYGWGNSWIDSPRKGYIDFGDDGWFISWEDGPEITLLDDSKHSNDILKNCGFAQN